MKSLHTYAPAVAPDTKFLFSSDQCLVSGRVFSIARMDSVIENTLKISSNHHKHLRNVIRCDSDYRRNHPFEETCWLYKFKCEVEHKISFKYYFLTYTFIFQDIATYGSETHLSLRQLHPHSNGVQRMPSDCPKYVANTCGKNWTGHMREWQVLRLSLQCLILIVPRILILCHFK